MTAALSATARSRLLAALGLAERPGTTGEREAAIYAVGRLVLAESDAIRALLAAPPPIEHRMPQMSVWRETCARLAEHRHLLRPWERGFVDDLPRFRRLSVKQRYVLNEIAARVLRDGAA